MSIEVGTDSIWWAMALSFGAVYLWPTAAPGWVAHTTRRRRDQRAEPDVADVMDHLALALAGGAGIEPALRHVGAATPGAAGREVRAVATALAWGLDHDVAWSQAPPRWAPIRGAMQLAARAGVAPSELLRKAAVDLRRDALARVEVDTARLSVALVLPLGLAFLPAFVLTTVVPVVLALARSLIVTW